MFNKFLHIKIGLFSICAVLGSSNLAYASEKPFTIYDNSPYGSVDAATVKKVGPQQYTVSIQPTDATPGVNTYGGTVTAKNRWDAVQKVEPLFDTGRKSKK